MTHEELLKKIDDRTTAGVSHFNSQALRAVVELHKPMLPPNMPAWCKECSYIDIAGNIVEWPCPTIQAIEKELK